MHYTFFESPVGPLLLAGDAGSLSLLGFPSGKGVVKPKSDWRHDTRPFREATRQLASYFNGDLKHFDLSLKPGGTPFQLQVYAELQNIPYGSTSTYGRIAHRIGRPTASRAVGAANGRNPIPIIIPCHRVIGSDGSLTGFGGGLDTKRFLLKLEGGAPGLQLDMPY